MQFVRLVSELVSTLSFSGSTIGLLRLWGSNHGRWLRAQHFFLILGLAVTHWINRGGAGLLHDDSTPVSAEQLPHQEYLFVVEGNRLQKQNYLFVVETENGTRAPTHLSSRNLTVQAKIDNLGEEKSSVRDVSFEIETVMSSVPTFLVAFGFLILTFYTFLRNKAQLSGRSVDDAEMREAPLRDLKYQDKFIVAAFFLTLGAIITVYQFKLGDLVYVAFVQSAVDVDKLNVFCFIAMTVGSFLGIFIPKRFERSFFLFSAICVTLFSVAVFFAFFFRQTTLGFVGSIALAFFVSNIPVATISLAFDHFEFSGVLISALVGRMIGILSGLFVIDSRLTKPGILHVVLPFGCVLLVCICLGVLARKRVRKATLVKDC